MKKSIVLAAAACAAACLCGCSSSCDPTPQTDGYAALNEMLAYGYSKVTLTVENSFDEYISLVSEYEIDFTSANSVKVTYSVERFSSISLDSPTGYKTTYKGVATIIDGVVVSVDGTDVGVTADIADTGMKFKAEYFENADLTGNYLKADVKDANAFLGTDIECSDMKVFATFLDFFYEIEITYSVEQDGEKLSEVKYSYLFTP